MATVEQITAKYDNVLVPVLPPGEGVCIVCKSVTIGNFTRCYRCNTHLSLAYTANAVDPIALSAKGGQWAHELSAYKNSMNPTVRETLAVRLSAVLWRWLARHEHCLASTAGVQRFPLITSVPSTSGRTDHPLPHMLRRIVGSTSDRYVDLLIPNPKYAAGIREAYDDRFFVPETLRGDPILVIDDQWTSGGRAQSAAAALRLSGAGPVAVAVLGRHFDRRPTREEYREVAQSYYSSASAQAWDWETCCLCKCELLRSAAFQRSTTLSVSTRWTAHSATCVAGSPAMSHLDTPRARSMRQAARRGNARACGCGRVRAGVAREQEVELYCGTPSLAGAGKDSGCEPACFPAYQLDNHAHASSKCGMAGCA